LFDSAPATRGDRTHCAGIALGEKRTGGGTSISGLEPPLSISVDASGMAPSLYAVPVGEDEEGSAGVVVACETDGLQKPIVDEVPNGDATGPVTPRGVTVEFTNDEGTAALVDDDGVAGDITTGAVTTGNVAKGDMIEGDVVEVVMAGQVDPAALIPFTGHVRTLPNAGACDWPRLPT
jgi:hypothetical protein